jgi:hypothetical protein
MNMRDYLTNRGYLVGDHFEFIAWGNTREGRFICHITGHSVHSMEHLSKLHLPETRFSR